MIAVVGGGVTGLAIGWELARRGADFVVLEASERAGGVVRTTRIDGRLLEWGPQRARLTPGLAALVTELGLEDEVVTAPPGLPLYVWREGRLRTVPLSWRELLATDAVSPGAKLRLLLEPFTAAADPTERVSRFFERKVGRAFYDAILAPLHGGLYGSDPAEMITGIALTPLLEQIGVRRSLLAALVRRGRIEPPPAASFRSGLEALPDALARGLGSRFLAGTAATGLERSGAHWRVRLAGGDGLDAEQVVVTAPAVPAAALLEGVAPAAAIRIRGLRYNPLGIVHLDAATDLHGLGFQVAFGGPPSLLRGVTFHDALFGRTNLYTAFLGGAQRPDVAEMSEDELAEAAVAEMRRTTGFDARPLAAAHVRMPAWDLSWRGLVDITLPPGLHVAGSWWSRPGLPGRFAEAVRVAESATGRRAA